MRILVDLDDTLVDMMSKSLYYYNHHVKANYYSDWKWTLDDIKTWELPDRHIFEDIWRIPGFFADLPFMDDAAPAILRLLKIQGHELVIVSAPPTRESWGDKYSWVHTNLLIPGIIDSMEQLVLTRGKHYINGDCVIDDKPENLEGRMFPILFDRPWNRDTKSYDRAYSWEGVIRYVERYDDLLRYPVCGYERERGA